jgi:hypothetical protein
VISDFLFDDAAAVVQELSMLNTMQDVFLVLVDSAFAFELPDISAGWVEIVDVETGHARTISRRQYRDLGARARRWQKDVQRTAKATGLDVVTIGLDQAAGDIALSEFVIERRLRKTKS